MMSRAVLLAAFLAVTLVEGRTFGCSDKACCCYDEEKGDGDSCKKKAGVSGEVGNCWGLKSDKSQVNEVQQSSTSTTNYGTNPVRGTYSGMSGWPDIENSEFRNFHEFFKYIPINTPSFATKADFTIKWECATKGYDPTLGVVGCDIFLFIYHCPPCKFEYEGGIGSILLSSTEAEFKMGTCGPTFNLDATNPMARDHPMAAYMAELDGDATVTIKTTHRTDFMFWGIVGSDVICSHKTTEQECGGSPLSCVWDGDSCEPRQCGLGNGMYWGGSPRCTYCVYDDEAHLVPEVL